MLPMEEAFHKDPYSWSFNALIRFGQWNLKTDNKLKKIAHDIYRILMVIYGFSIAAIGFIDLYQYKDNFEKAAFNLCTTTLSFGITVKNLHIMMHSPKLDQLRLNLFSNAWTQTDPKEMEIKDYFKNIWLLHHRVLVLAASLIMPIWWITSLSSLIWGPRELPFPVYLPFDLNNNFQYFCGFFYHVTGSFYIGMEVLHADLGMFSLMLQIAAQYGILAKNIEDLDLLYSDDPVFSKEKETNLVLANYKAKEKLKQCVKKQLTLIRSITLLGSVVRESVVESKVMKGFHLDRGSIDQLLTLKIILKKSLENAYSIIACFIDLEKESNQFLGIRFLARSWNVLSMYVSLDEHVCYVKELEYCYSSPMLIQLFCAFLLSVGNGLELIVVSMNFSVKLSYQLLYSSIVLGDIFMICTLCELMKSQYEKLEKSLYDVSWYKMDVSCRRDLYLMTLRAQKYSNLTAGKMIQLDRRTFRGMIKNLYSWLALCRQVMIKK